MSTQARPKRSAWASIVVALLAYLAYALFVQLAVPPLIRSSGLPRAQWRWAVWLISGALGLLLLVPLFLRDRGLAALFRVPAWQYAVAAALLLAAAAARVLLLHQGVGGTVGALAFFLVGVALVEETLFRGFLWRRLEEALSNRWWVLLVSSLLFTVIHVPAWVAQGRDFAPLTPVVILVIGSVLGLVRMFSRGLVLPTALHAAIDLVQN